MMREILEKAYALFDGERSVADVFIQVPLEQVYGLLGYTSVRALLEAPDEEVIIKIEDLLKQ